MQSSPPFPHRRDNAPSSPSQSQYSLDLNALTLDSHSEPSSPLATGRVDQVRSDDIDGPTDFTINMEKWMNGTPKRPSAWSVYGSMRVPRATSLQQAKPREVKKSEERVHTNGAQAENQQGSEDVSEDGLLPESESHTQDTPVTAERIERNTEGSATPRAGDGDSVWEEYQEPSSPHPMKNNGFLQPTVEDYNSELTPARPLSASRHTPLRPLSPGRPSSPTLSPVRSPSRTPQPPSAAKETGPPNAELEGLRSQLLEVRKKQKDQMETFRTLHEEHEETKETLDRCRSDYSLKEQEHRNDLTDAMEKLQEQEEQNARLRTELEEARKAEKSAAQENAKLQHDLDEMRESEDAELHDLRWQLKQAGEGDKTSSTQLADVESRLQTTETERQQLQQALEAAKAEMAVTKQEVKKQNRQRDDENESLQNELKSARNAERAACTKLETLREQANSSQATYKDETEGLRAQLEALRSSAQSPQASMINAKLEKDLAAERQARANAQEELEAVREELDMLQNLSHLEQDDPEPFTPHPENQAANTAALEAANRAAAQAQARAEELEHTVVSLREELRHQPEPITSGISPDLVEDLQTQLSALRSNLSTALISLTASQTHNTTLQADLASTRQELSELKDVNSLFEARIATALRKREDEWRRKEMQLKDNIWRLEKERAVMGKALLRQWGREECGIDGFNEKEAGGKENRVSGGRDQRFRYKYAKEEVLR